ncbi:heavy metal translocating P-type ATPase [Rubrimonas sp.]|uniref:heavy metal translocating P-type ATPase n=1 Tax=Rubrimonas sp. TaxID=2036015 RepID=UPI002FDD08FF
MGCCPTEAACDAAGAGGAADRLRASELRHAVREVSPGVGYLQLIAPGMHCGGCVATLERGLRKLDGVRSARANLTAKRLAVEFDLDRADAAAIAAEAERLGFQTHPMEAADAAQAAEKRETADLLTRLGVAAFASMNIMLLSVSVWAGAEDATRDLMHWISAVIAAPVVIYSGRPFYVSALAGLRARRLNMDAPISIAVIGALAISLYETARGGPEAFFDAAVTLLFLLLIGRYLDRLMRAKARSAAADLARLQPRGAMVLGPDGAAWRPLEEISPGDRISVAAGERIAVDGVVEAGASDVDMSHVTGETAPEALGPGGLARAGALNLSGALTLRATAVGEASSLGEVQRLMSEAESRKSRVARLADVAASVYAPVIHLVALATFLGWIWLGADWREAAFIAIALLIITCPCALGLAAPMAQAVAAGTLFRRGVMLKDGAALERLALVDRVVFDKTGTLTDGRPVMRPPATDAPRASLAAAAALAGASRHPLSAALADWAHGRGFDAAATDVAERPGFGVEGLVDGVPAKLGRAAFVGARDDAEAGASAVWLKVGDADPVAFLFDERPRPGAAETIRALAEDGLGVEILSGDRPGPVAALARRLGVERWRASASPQDKIAHVAAIAESGGRALMVGDGVNDAPALAAASVSMAPASAADIGRAAADMVFFGADLRAVAEARRLARRTRAVILQNFAIAACYNCVAIPIAVTGHASPLVAAIAMSSSSIVVVANALRLQAGASPAARRAAAEARLAGQTAPEQPA